MFWLGHFHPSPDPEKMILLGPHLSADPMCGCLPGAGVKCNGAYGLLLHKKKKKIEICQALTQEFASSGACHAWLPSREKYASEILMQMSTDFAAISQSDQNSQYRLIACQIYVCISCHVITCT